MARLAFIMCPGFLLVVSAACNRATAPGDDLPFDSSTREVGNPCPFREPRPGVECKLTSAAPLTCTYTVAMCREGAASRSYTRTYCCEQGSWEMCGLSQPCEEPPEDAGLDVAADTPVDGGTDDAMAAEVSQDGPPSGPLCGGAPPPMVCAGVAGCSPCPGGPPAPCTCFGSTWFCQVCPDAGAGGDA